MSGLGPAVRVSVIVLTWNSSRVLERALGAVNRERRRVPLELIVVDNGSTDGSIALVNALVPDAQVVRNTRNLGVARARNQGMRLARGEYILLLDSDTDLTPGSLETMVEFLDGHPRTAVVGAQLIYPDGTLQYSCRRFPTVPGKLLRLLPLSWRRTLRWVAEEELLTLDRTTAQPVDYVIGACQLIRRSVIAALGGLDEQMFYGPEDVDFCMRVWRAGWAVCYVPTAVVIHDEQRVTRRHPGMLTLRHMAALARYFVKHRYAWRRPVIHMEDGRPRVLHVVTLSEWGGAQAYVWTLARHLMRTCDVTVACAPGGPLVSRLRADGIRVVEIPTLIRKPSLLADPPTFARLLRLMLNERFALVHCHSTKAGLLGRFAAWAAGVPHILFTAHGWPFTGWWHPLIRAAYLTAERSAAAISTAIVCVSEYDRQTALRMGIGGADRLIVIRNGIDPARWVADTQGSAEGQPAGEGRESYDPNGACSVVSVARLTEQKDPEMLLDAWRRVPPPHRLVLIGDGPMRPHLEDLARQLGPDRRVRVLGARDDVPDLLRRAHVFALASRWEGLPFAVIEAMMSGLPVVATAVGGLPEIVADGETGILVPDRDPIALAAALRQLLDSHVLRRQMGDAGRRRALAHFTEARMLAETDALYGGMLATASTTTSLEALRG